MPDVLVIVQRLAIYIVPLLLGVVCHEVAHGYVAYLQGDPTAKAAGRLTLNPIKHLSPVGSLVFVVLAFVGPFVIGWAKPVPVNPYHFRNLRRGMFLVSLAGPATNLILAVLFALAFHGVVLLAPFSSVSLHNNVLYPLAQICQAGVSINIILALFNLLPLPPLDGSKILASLLPAPIADRYMALERFGMVILLVLLVSGVLWEIIRPVLNFVGSLLI